MENGRRGSARMLVEWVGHLRFGDDPGSRWRSCRILDLSPGGVGVELAGIDLEDLGRRPVELQMVLVGELRHRRLDAGMLRAGIELNEVSGEAAADGLEAAADGLEAAGDEESLDQLEGV